jgi:hypothetical protein
MRKDKIMRIRTAIVLGAAALSVSACSAADGAYGPGYALGYGSSDAFSCYDGAYGYGYGYGGYGSGYCGWYDGFFYPGFGNFVFDRNHHRHQMSGSQHDYFVRQAQGPDGGRRVGLGSSGGVNPPAFSRPQPATRNGVATGPRGGFGGGMRHRPH